MSAITDAQFEALVRERDDVKPATLAAVPELASVAGLREALEAAAQPRLRVVISVAQPGLTLVHRVWVGDQAATYLAALDDTSRQLIVTTPEFLGSGLARLVGLGPRTGESIGAGDSLDPADIDRLFGEKASERDAALARTGATAAWMIAVDAENGEMASCVLDRPDGYVEAVADEAGVRLEARTPTYLWRILGSLLLQVDPVDAHDLSSIDPTTLDDTAQGI